MVLELLSKPDFYEVCAFISGLFILSHLSICLSSRHHHAVWKSRHVCPTTLLSFKIVLSIWVPCVSTWVLGSVFQFPQKWSQGVFWDFRFITGFEPSHCVVLWCHLSSYPLVFATGWASWNFVFLVFTKFGNISSIISSNIFPFTHHLGTPVTCSWSHLPWYYLTPMLFPQNSFPPCVSFWITSMTLLLQSLFLVCNI